MLLNSMARVGLSLAACVVGILFSSNSIFAASDFSIKQCHTGKDSISVYVDSNGVPIDSATCQIGRLESENIEIHPISELDTPLRTLFLMDNSLSITTEYRPEISEIISGVIDGHLNGEEFRLATIDTEIHYLGEYSTNYDDLIKQLGDIQYNNQDTYFTDLIYYALEDLYEDSDPAYSRIVVISDGADDMDIGIKGSEVTDIARSSNIPVYSIGVVYKNNQERLKNMFSVSRSTGATYYNLSESSVSEVIEGLASDRKLSAIEVFPPREQLDGSSKSMKLSLHTSQGDRDLTADVKMPFGDADTAVAATTVTEPEVEPEKESEPIIPQVEESKEEPEQESSVPLDKILLLLLLILLAALYFWTQKKKKNGTAGDKKETKKEEKKKAIHVAVPGDNVPSKGEEKAKEAQTSKANAAEMETVISSDAESETVLEAADEEKTVIEGATVIDDATVIDEFTGKNPARKIRSIMISDRNDPGHVEKFSLDKRVVIGRKKELNNYALPQDKRVSSQHCYIEENEDGEILLCDLNSTNGLICNDQKVVNMVKLSGDSVLMLGSTELVVKILG